LGVNLICFKLKYIKKHHPLPVKLLLEQSFKAATKAGIFCLLNDPDAAAQLKP